MDTYTTAVKAAAGPFIANRYDFVIGGSYDPRLTKPNDVWTAYVDSAFVYSNEIYKKVKGTATARGYNYEDMLLHIKQDYTVAAGLAWANQAQFDFHDQPDNYAGPGSTSVARNGALLYNGTSFTDVTSSAFTGSTTITDRLYLGYAEPFDQVNYNVSTATTKTVTYTYFNGTGWSTLTPRSDTSNGIRATGQFLFTPPSNWAPTSINGGRSKYWVLVTLSGAGTNPVTSKIYGDDWVSHSGTNNCRGWSATDPNRVNVGLGNLEYNPTPPAGATAKFRYQARATGIWANNGNFGNVGNVQGGRRTWADLLTDAVLSLVPTSASPNGIMFDDGLAAPSISAPSGTIETLSDLPSGTWKDNGTTVYTDVVANLHSLLGASFKVGVNTPYQMYALNGDWALDEITINTTNNGENPMSKGYRGTGVNGGQDYDSYLAANNARGTKGMFTTWSASNQGFSASGGTWVPYDQGNRGPINALATYYVAANPNTYFSYNTYGWSYFESDEVYYFTSPTTTTAAIAANTGSGAKTISAVNVAPFVNLALYSTIYVRLGAGGDVVRCTKTNSTTLSTTDPIRNAYAAGTQISYAVMAHQSQSSLPPLADVWKWGPWFPAIGVDIGQPETAANGGNRNTAYMTGPASSGNSAACGSACSEVWRRVFTKATVLSRVAHWNTGGSEFNTPSVPIALGGTFYPLRADGTTGAGITSIQLKGGESAILMKAPVP